MDTNDIDMPLMDAIDKTESTRLACGWWGSVYISKPHSQNKQICIKLSHEAKRLEHRKHG